MNILEELVKQRIQLGLTQIEVALRMNVAQSTVSQFEDANNDPRLSTLQRYARAVGLSVTLDSYEPTPDECAAWVRENINKNFPDGYHETVQDDYLNEAYNKIQQKAWNEGMK